MCIILDRKKFCMFWCISLILFYTGYVGGFLRAVKKSFIYVVSKRNSNKNLAVCFTVVSRKIA